MDVGADLEIKNNDGKAALDLAQEGNRSGIVEMLIAAGD